MTGIQHKHNFNYEKNVFLHITFLFSLITLFNKEKIIIVGFLFLNTIYADIHIFYFFFS